MLNSRLFLHAAIVISALLVLSTVPVTLLSAEPQGAAGSRPMTFLDMQEMRQMGSPAVSPDGRWLLYSVNTPDWKEAKRQSDIYLVSMQQGLSSTRQMTFTKEKNESDPEWSADGSAFFFLSNREAPSNASSQNQLFLMRPDGGDARRITDAKEGVSNFALSRDGRWLMYRSGKEGEEQLYRLPIAGLDTASPEQITKQAGGVKNWAWPPDSRRIYFIGPEIADTDGKLRREKKFTVDIRNAETPLSSLWTVDFDPLRTTQLTHDASITVSGFTLSEDSKWVGFRGTASSTSATSFPMTMSMPTGTSPR